MKSIRIHSLRDMEQLGTDLVKDCPQRPLILALEGNLGAGKTTFAQYIGKALGVKEAMTSPTFILHLEYEGLDHLDLYRLESKVEFDELRIFKMLTGNKVVVIEWADKFKNEIVKISNKANLIWIKFEHAGTDSRIVKIYHNEDISD